MEKEMTGADRRKKLIFLMRESEQPLSGTQLGQVTGVSRQVVVQDIALLRTEGYPIVSTAKGGTVLNVMVNHRVYGRVEAALNIRNRRDVQGFLNDLRTGKSVPLLNVTSGYHFHKISAESEEVLDEIEHALQKKGFLAEVMPYEQETHA